MPMASTSPLTKSKSLRNVLKKKKKKKRDFPNTNDLTLFPCARHLYVSDLMNHTIVVLNIQKDNTLSRVKVCIKCDEYA